jgi:hypothetical protein
MKEWDSGLLVIDRTREPDMFAPEDATHIVFDYCGHTFWMIQDTLLYMLNFGQWALMEKEN